MSRLYTRYYIKDNKGNKTFLRVVCEKQFKKLLDNAKILCYNIVLKYEFNEYGVHSCAILYKGRENENRRIQKTLRAKKTRVE